MSDQTILPAVFYFAFAVDDDDGNPQERAFGLVISPDGASALPPDGSALMEDLGVDHLEDDFGVHDWSSSPDDRVRGIGYCSYEVPEARIEELMGRWRQAFVEACGEDSVSAVVEFQREESWNDFAIYEAIKQKVSP